MIPLYTMRQRVLAERQAFVRAFADPGPPSGLTTLRSRAEDLIAQGALADHAFFSIPARDAQRAVRLWLTEEYSVLNTFSQLLCRVAGSFDNMWLRSRFLEIVVGEHRAAQDSHPHPLAAPLSRLNIDQTDLWPLGPAHSYVRSLRRISNSCPLAAMGAIGVGHEMGRKSEHPAVLHMFSELPEPHEHTLEQYSIESSEADETHAEACLEIALLYAQLYECGLEDFWTGARRALRARHAFYDGLIKAINRQAVVH